MLSNIKRKADDLATTEYADGAVSVEYVGLIMFGVGILILMLVFRQTIAAFITAANTKITSLLSEMTNTQGTAGTPGGTLGA